MGGVFTSRLEGLGERNELPQCGPGWNLNEKQILCIVSITEHFWLQDIVNHENSILQAEM